MARHTICMDRGKYQALPKQQNRAQKKEASSSKKTRTTWGMLDWAEIVQAATCSRCIGLSEQEQQDRV